MGNTHGKEAFGLGGGTAKSVSRKSMRQNYVSLLFYQGMGR